jgi:glycine/D-amino acid oxidase-like deaminating enzyme
VNAESPPAADRFDAEFDLVVLGSGASGMTAALVAAVEGASALVLESTAYVGGTSARSSGTLWIPPAGDTAVTAYLDALVGEKADRSLREAFLAAGPAMIACLAQHAGFCIPAVRACIPTIARTARRRERSGRSASRSSTVACSAKSSSASDGRSAS